MIYTHKQGNLISSKTNYRFFHLMGVNRVSEFIVSLPVFRALLLSSLRLRVREILFHSGVITMYHNYIDY